MGAPTSSLRPDGSDLAKLHSSTLILARLFARMEGAGYMTASVPVGMEELALRIGVENDLLGYVQWTQRGNRLYFHVSSPGVAAIRSVLMVPKTALVRDAVGLQEVLARAGGSGFEVNALQSIEMEYLQTYIGDGPWSRLVPVIREREF